MTSYSKTYVIGVGRACSHWGTTLSMAVRGPAPAMVSLAVVLTAESTVRGGLWASPQTLGSQAGGWAGGPRDRLRAVSHWAPEPSPWPSTGRAQALKQQWTSALSLPPRPNGGGSLHGSRSEEPGLDGLRSLRAGWVLGALLPQWWWLGRVWEPGPEGAASWDLSFQPGLGTGGRTQTGCRMDAPGQDNWPAPGQDTQDTRPHTGGQDNPLLLARAWTSEGESWALGPCPLLSEQRITFVLLEVYGNIVTWLWPDLKNKGPDLKKFATTNHAHPSPFL